VRGDATAAFEATEGALDAVTRRRVSAGFAARLVAADSP